MSLDPLQLKASVNVFRVMNKGWLSVFSLFSSWTVAAAGDQSAQAHAMWQRSSPNIFLFKVHIKAQHSGCRGHLSKSYTLPRRSCVFSQFSSSFLFFPSPDAPTMHIHQWSCRKQGHLQLWDRNVQPETYIQAHTEILWEENQHIVRVKGSEPDFIIFGSLTS